MKLWAWLVDLWARRCSHPGEWVTYDLNETVVRDEDGPFRYCNRCGSVRPPFSLYWRRPCPRGM